MIKMRTDQIQCDSILQGREWPMLAHGRTLAGDDDASCRVTDILATAYPKRDVPLAGVNLSSGRHPRDGRS